MGAEKDYGIRLYGLPTGYEFGLLVDAILDVSRGESQLSDETKAALAALEKPATSRCSRRPPDPTAPGRSAWPFVSPWRATRSPPTASRSRAFPSWPTNTASPPCRRPWCRTWREFVGAGPEAMLLAARAGRRQGRRRPDRLTALPSPRRSRELYLDAFRGLMALVMVQGHVCDLLLSEACAERPLPAPAPLPRLHRARVPVRLGLRGGLAPRSPVAPGRAAPRPAPAVRPGRRLLAPPALLLLLEDRSRPRPAEKAALFACHALQVIAVTQLLVLALQLVAPRAWTWSRARSRCWSSPWAPACGRRGVSTSLPPWLAPYLDERTGSTFPFFPYAAFVLAGTVAGAVLGRQHPAERRRRTLVAAGSLLLLGAWPRLAALRGRVDFWKISPGYVLLRLGGLLLLLRLVEAAALRGLPGSARAGPPRTRDPARLRAPPHLPVRRRHLRRLAAPAPRGSSLAGPGHAGARPDGARASRRGLGLEPREGPLPGPRPARPRVRVALVRLRVPAPPLVASLPDGDPALPRRDRRRRGFARRERRRRASPG